MTTTTEQFGSNAALEYSFDDYWCLVIGDHLDSVQDLADMWGHLSYADQESAIMRAERASLDSGPGGDIPECWAEHRSQILMLLASPEAKRHIAG